MNGNTARKRENGETINGYEQTPGSLGRPKQVETLAFAEHDLAAGDCRWFPIAARLTRTTVGQLYVFD
jgi:hypothetical protein